MTDDASDDADARDAVPVRPVDLRDYVDFSPDAATRVRVFTTAHLSLDVWGLEPQQATPVLHLAERDVTYTVLGGRSWFVTDAGEIGLDPMAAMLVPADTAHGFENRAPDPLIVLAFAAPPSDEPETPPVERRDEAVRFETRTPSRLRRAFEGLLGERRD